METSEKKNPVSKSDEARVDPVTGKDQRSDLKSTWIHMKPRDPQ
jgi:hypothetical protein